MDGLVMKAGGWLGLALLAMAMAVFAVDWPFLTNLRDRGREIADEWLNANFEHLGVRSSVDLRAMFDGESATHLG